MSNIAIVIGKRIRNYRTQAGLSQEKLAELCGCHPTYIGQLERGEKNATLESVAKIASALNIPLSTLFEGLGRSGGTGPDIPLQCYEIILGKTEREQHILLNIIKEIDKYGKL